MDERINKLLPMRVEPLPITTVSSAVGGLLFQIRPEWKAKSLIERVEKLLPVDPSSACQRLLNAAIHDLREKVVVAGLDIAKEAAQRHGLPPITKPEDVENYSTDRILDLTYHMGLLRRPEWKKLKRCYDIRRDLEHEDDEYTAEVDDCVYIFKNCIEIVLARDPVQLLRVTDVKQVIEQEIPQFPREQFVDEYCNAPDSRQKDIMMFLVSTALDGEQPDVVRANAAEMIKNLSSATSNQVKIDIAGHLQNRVGRGVFPLAMMKLAHAAGITGYLKRNSRNDYFRDLLRRLNRIGYDWRRNAEHGSILDELEDVGGVTQCSSPEIAQAITNWLVLCYIGEPGGYGAGSSRPVFYSNTAAPIIERLVGSSGQRELEFLKTAVLDKEVEAALARKKAIANRYDKLLDLAGDV